MAASEVVWTQEKEEELVSMWQTMPCLFDTTSPEYMNRQKRMDCIVQMVSTLEIPGEFVVIRSTKIAPFYNININSVFISIMYQQAINLSSVNIQTASIIRFSSLRCSLKTAFAKCGLLDDNFD